MEMDDAAAVARVKAGEKDAFRLLVERHSQTIFRVAFRMMQNEQDAEEIVQDTFLRAYRALDGFQQLTAAGGTALIIRHFGVGSVEEIARVLNVCEGAANNRIHRAVQKQRIHEELIRIL